MGKSKDGPYRHACHECKSRHLKCDRVQPSCMKCSSAGRQCDLGGCKKYLFRHDHNPSVVTEKKGGKRRRRSQLRWGDKQNWAPVQPNLKFIDKSHDLDFLESSESDNGFDQDEESPQILSDWPVVEVDNSEFVHEVPKTSYLASQRNHGIALHSLKAVAPSSNLVNGENLHRSPPLLSIINPKAVSHGEMTQSTDRLFTPASPNNLQGLWPLQNEDEVILLRHFISDLCPWFDYCDRDKHFRNMVLPASATDPKLLDAILAVAARHLGLQGKFDRYAADRYQRRCLESLIPQFNDQDTLPDELPFAGAIILRLLDEMTEDDPTIRFQGHGLSTTSLIRGREETLYSSPLCVTCLRIELRQEVTISFKTRKPTPMVAQYCNIDLGLGPSDDWTWTYRMIACLADCLNFCYGPKHGNITEEYGKLSQYLDDWARHCPPTFKPIGSTKADNMKGKILPKLWFLDDCHVAAAHHLGLSRILLLAHDPTVPLLGVDRKMRTEQIDEQIREQVRLLCGIAISNRQHFTAMFTAGAAIATCGERFTDPEEQRVLLDILVEAEEHVAWPSLRFQDILKEVWGI